MASVQPLSAFALVESALLPLSGDGSIFNRCLEYFGDTPTIIMTLLDGEADEGEDDGEGDGATVTAGSIWSHVVSFMDAFTLASLDMTCRHAYFADGWKTADRWVEWDQQLFEFATGTPATATRDQSCQNIYKIQYRRSVRQHYEYEPFPYVFRFRRDGKSRFRVLQFSGTHLSMLYHADKALEDEGEAKLQKIPLCMKPWCGCPIHAAIGTASGWRRFPVRVKEKGEEGKMVSNRR